jgi:hypothetical protein
MTIWSDSAFISSSVSGTLQPLSRAFGLYHTIDFTLNATACPTAPSTVPSQASP